MVLFCHCAPASFFNNSCRSKTFDEPGSFFPGAKATLTAGPSSGHEPLLTMAGLYVHIPFCPKVYPYCEAYCVTKTNGYKPFVKALLIELDHYAAQYAAGEPVETVYIGGGEPSLLPLPELKRVVRAIYQRFDTAALTEFTVEVTPAHLSQRYLEALREMGANRLSVGIQSFYKQDLERLEKPHTPQQAEDALSLAASAGFTNYSVDLLFGIPGQPMEYWQANLQKAVRAQVPHIATYRLTAGSGLNTDQEISRGSPQPSSPEKINEQYLWALQHLRSCGYEAYEISHFAQPNYRAQHNQRYWTHDNYLGLGPSAHSFWWPSKQDQPPVRWNNVANLPRYQALLKQGQVPLEDKQPLSPAALANEFIMLRLQTAEGIDLRLLQEKYHLDLSTVKAKELTWLTDEGLIKRVDNNYIQLTDTGKLQHDPIASKLLVPAEAITDPCN